MSIEIIQRRSKLIYIRALGKCEDQSLNFWKTIQSLSKTNYDKPILLEYSGKLERDAIDLYRYAQEIKALDLDKDLRIAILCKHPISFEIMRSMIKVIKAYTDQTLKVFIDDDFAQEWLLENDTFPLKHSSQ